MKHLILILTAIFFVTNLSFAKGNLQTYTAKVSGVCNQCKERIEEAAYSVEGVKTATWNKKTHLLVIVFNAKKTSKEAVLKAVANIGHDADTILASNEVYKSLPACCAYRDGANCAH
jgi:periplasmic mercuric ion binding protein